jgi:hypothetical protein
MSSQVPRLPRIPRVLLEQHDAFVAGDRPFTAAARLLQSLWRAERGFAVGISDNRRLGSYLTAPDAERGANFLPPTLATFVHRELAVLDRRARIDSIRLFRNLLSSQPLCFNLFAPLALNLPLASAFFAALAPDLIADVTELIFEHAPGRSAPSLTGDNTAFDLFVRACDAARARTALAFELKYTETLVSETATPRLSLESLAARSGLFRNPTAPALRVAPLQQFWRTHLLTLSLAGEGRPYVRSRFFFIAPQLNLACWDAVAAYNAHLISADPIVTGFQALTLEECLARLDAAGAPEMAAALHARYLDFDRVLDTIIASRTT